MNQKKLVILTGPTGVGKTALSIKLAKEINAEIISADSIQVYTGMDIGSAKIKPEETEGIKHHLIDICDPKEEFNAFIFKEKAKEALNDISSRGKIPLVVGGTGFYIQTLLQDIDFSEEDNSELRPILNKRLEEEGLDVLYNELLKLDPKTAMSIDGKNSRKVIRALEFFQLNGTSFSEYNNALKEKESPYNFACFVLRRERDTLYKLINQRVDIMINDGLVDEVKRMLDYGCVPGMTSMQGLGYKEIIKYLDNQQSLEDSIEEIKNSTRHFAKRQLTWFKSKDYVNWLDYEKYSGIDNMLEVILNTLKEKGII